MHGTAARVVREGLLRRARRASEGATDKDISRAYKKLAKKYHPDANQGDAAAEETLQGGLRGVRRARRRREAARSTTRSVAMVAVGSGPRRFGPGGSQLRPGRVPLRLRHLRRRRPLRWALRARPAQQGRGAAAGPRPRDRAPPRLPRRRARGDQLGPLHVGCGLLGMQRVRCEGRDVARDLRRVPRERADRDRPGPVLVRAGLHGVRRARRRGARPVPHVSWPRHRGEAARGQGEGARRAWKTASGSG